MNDPTHIRRLLAAALTLLFTDSAAAAQEVAGLIFIGGEVVTVNDAQPIAKAAAVKDGKILVVGAKASVLAHKGEATDLVYMGGATLIPGIIDPHSHFFNALAVQDQPNVSYPQVGSAKKPRRYRRGAGKFRAVTEPATRRDHPGLRL